MHTTTVPSKGSAFRAVLGGTVDGLMFVTKASVTGDAAAATQRTQAMDFIVGWRTKNDVSGEPRLDIEALAFRTSKSMMERLATLEIFAKFFYLEST